MIMVRHRACADIFSTVFGTLTATFSKALVAMLDEEIVRGTICETKGSGSFSAWKQMNLTPYDPTPYDPRLLTPVSPDQDQDDNRAARGTCDIATPQRYA
ncbi:MAG TPA: hypothetical protein VFE77_00185 [Rhodanobacter sp.]|nr:hypothetical protein [Rhodanobacter sp.]